MDIHKEKDLRHVKDSQLMKKLLVFAKPYWKRIVFSFLLAALIVMATLIQPFLIKIVIDDRIGGLYKPMIQMTEAFPESEVDAWEKRNRKSLQGTIDWQGDTYFRIHPDRLDEIVLQAGLEKKQIVDSNAGRFMLAGWGEEHPEAVAILESLEAGDTAESLTVTAVLLSAEDIDVFRSRDYVGFAILGIVFFLIVAGAAVLNYLQTKLLENTGQQVIFDIRQAMFGHLSKLHTGYYDRNPVGRLVTRVSHDVEALNQLYSQVIVNLVKEVCMLIGIIGFMLVMSVELTLITFTVLPILGIITFYYRTVVRKAQRNVRLVLSKLNSFLAENLSGILIIQIFAREKKQLEKFDEMNEEYYRAGMRATVLNSIFNPAVGLFGNLALAVLIWYGGQSVIAGAVTFGVLYAFTQYTQQFYRPLMGLADRYTQIQTAMASAERIFELLEEKPAIQDSANQNSYRLKAVPERVKGAISFEKVWFAYNEDDWVLKDVSFRVNPGETIAFVGATGAGKSSIINLITRFYEIGKGSLKVEGIDVRNWPVAELRKRVAMIQQDSFVFTGDVAFNIRLNHNEATLQTVMETAEQLGMDEFIKQLPDGYQTLLGEQGVRLSSGQQQLISFLRAAVFQPDILILDEATAHIDTETEQLVQTALKRISQDRTTLIVAHRLSTIQHADKIIVLHKGQIQEIGNHDQLLKRKGYYHRLFEMQNQNRDDEMEEEVPAGSVARKMEA